MTSAVCPSCGHAFGCDPAGDCWCKAVEIRLPMPPDKTAACLCPRCVAVLSKAREPARAADD